MNLAQCADTALKKYGTQRFCGGFGTITERLSGTDPEIFTQSQMVSAYSPGASGVHRCGRLTPISVSVGLGP